MNHRTRIKYCGLTRLQDVEAALAAGADAIGLVFYEKSVRNVSAEVARDLVAGLPPYVTVTGLFVNASLEFVAHVCETAPLGLLQFHGDETWDHCAAIASAVARPYTRALRIGADATAADLLESQKNGLASGPWFSSLVLDTLVEGYGGGGKVFDWSLVPRELAPRVVLSGGLNAYNVIEAIARVRPYAVDVSSGIEREKGVKDAERMMEFARAVRRADSSL